MATPTNLPASFTTGAVLTAAEQNALRGAFRILQVVTGTYATPVNSTNTTFVDSGLTATITPQSATSKIFVAVNETFYASIAGLSSAVRLVRAGTTIQEQIDSSYNAGSAAVGNASFLYLDSPASTSALIYKTMFNNRSAAGVVTAQINNNPANITLFEISA